MREKRKKRIKVWALKSPYGPYTVPASEYMRAELQRWAEEHQYNMSIWKITRVTLED